MSGTKFKRGVKIFILDLAKELTDLTTETTKSICKFTNICCGRFNTIKRSIGVGVNLGRQSAQIADKKSFFSSKIKLTTSFSLKNYLIEFQIKKNTIGQ